MFERCRKEMVKVLRSIHKVERFNVFYHAVLSMFESAQMFLFVNFIFSRKFPAVISA